MNKDYQKAFKKLTLFFLLNPVPFKGQSYQKQNGPGTSDQLLFRLQIKSRKNVFISCILSDQIWYVNLMIFNDNVKPFLSYFKNSICKFMQANSWQIIPLPFVLFNLESAEGIKKITKIWISWEKKRLLDEIMK